MTNQRCRPIQRRTPLRPRNPERRAKLQLLQFGAYADYIRELPCACCDRSGPSDPHHVLSRGAGGRWYDCVPLCRTCHDELHQVGQATFCEERNLNFDLMIEGYLRRFHIEQTIVVPLRAQLAKLPDEDQFDPVAALLLVLTDARAKENTHHHQQEEDQDDA